MATVAILGGHLMIVATLSLLLTVVSAVNGLHDLAGNWRFDGTKSPGPSSADWRIGIAIAEPTITLTMEVGGARESLIFHVDGRETDLGRRRTGTATWTKGRLVVTMASPQESSRLAFSRDGAWLLLEWDRGHGPATWYFARERRDTVSVPSPDGSLVAYVPSSRGEAAALRFMRARGRAPLPYAAPLMGGLAGRIQWSPDGASVVYAVVERDRAEGRTLLFHYRIGGAARLIETFDRDEAVSYDVTADSRYLVITAGRRTSKVDLRADGSGSENRSPASALRAAQAPANDAPGWIEHLVGRWTTTATHYFRDGTSLEEHGDIDCRWSLSRSMVQCEREHRATDGTRRSSVQVWQADRSTPELQVVTVTAGRFGQVVQRSTALSAAATTLTATIPWQGRTALTRGTLTRENSELLYRNETEESPGVWRVDFVERWRPAKAY